MQPAHSRCPMEPAFNVVFPLWTCISGTSTCHPSLSEVDNFDWASRVEQQIQTSLHRLVLFIHARQEPDKVQALRVTLSCHRETWPS